MSRVPSTSSRWAAWGFALLLLLKASVPLLAAASAQAQGKTLVEVCTVYGVATVALDNPGSTPAPDHGNVGHGGEHCALSALMALNGPEAHAVVVADSAHGAPALQVRPGPPLHDAMADWVARLKHGPPNAS